MSSWVEMQTAERRWKRLRGSQSRQVKAQCRRVKTLCADSSMMVSCTSRGSFGPLFITDDSVAVDEIEGEE